MTEWGVRLGDGTVITMVEAVARVTIGPSNIRVRTPGEEWRVPTESEVREFLGGTP